MILTLLARFGRQVLADGPSFQPPGGSTPPSQGLPATPRANSGFLKGTGPLPPGRLPGAGRPSGSLLADGVRLGRPSSGKLDAGSALFGRLMDEIGKEGQMGAQSLNDLRRFVDFQVAQLNRPSFGFPEKPEKKDKEQEDEEEEKKRRKPKQEQGKDEDEES